jgi:aminoglycoside phosphotransferase (APT) family kinase protein
MGPTREEIDASLAARLVAGQFPQWAHLPVRPVSLSGWDNRTFHLGDERLIRLPSHASYADQVAKEQVWLPRLAPLLPLPIPAPLALGSPTDEYPWPWSIYSWIDGEPAQTAPPPDMVRFAADLAAFLRALYALDATGGPPPGAHNFLRGAHPEVYDAQTREAFDALEGKLDVARLRAHWAAAMATRWEAPAVWVHGDIATSNLLVQDGVLSAVIDFGCSCVGDPACDLAIAWTDLRGEAREAFRTGLRLDDATWQRGRAWALWKAAIIASRISRSFEPWITRSWATLAELVAEPV